MAKTKSQRRAAAKSTRKAAKPARSARASSASRKGAAGKRRAKPASRKSKPAPRKAAPRRGSAAGKKAAPRPAAKKVAKPPKKVALRSGSRKVTRQATKVATKVVGARTPLKAMARTSTPKSTTPRVGRAPTLDRPRRSVGEVEMVPSPPSSLDLDRSASAARTGRAEMNDKLHEHTSSSPALTAGDVDADWEGAESTGDEAPGGDNMTPDQDVVDEIGKALGVVYDDDEELRGGEEIVERDRKRWELDPASSDDFDDRDEK